MVSATFFSALNSAPLAFHAPGPSFCQAITGYSQEILEFVL